VQEPLRHTETDGGRKLVPRAWGGRFPFQARVTLVSPEIVEVPVKVVEDYIVNPTSGRRDNVIEDERAEELIRLLRGMTQVG